MLDLERAIEGLLPQKPMNDMIRAKLKEIVTNLEDIIGKDNQQIKK